MRRSRSGRVVRRNFARGWEGDDGGVTSRICHGATGSNGGRHDRVIGDIGTGVVVLPRLRGTNARCKALKMRNYFA
jgi:hypothetical protein